MPEVKKFILNVGGELPPTARCPGWLGNQPVTSLFKIFINK